MLEKTIFIETDSECELFDQFGCLKNYVTTKKIEKWNEESTPADKRWAECFTHFAKNHLKFDCLLRIVQYIFSLPGTSATVERIFSIVNNIWTPEKNRLQIKTLQDILFVKYNLKLNCLEFYDMLKNSPELLKKISSEDKYNYNKNKETDELELPIDTQPSSSGFAH